MSSHSPARGVAVQGTGEQCECCRVRKAVGVSISGLAICVRCARDAQVAADELAREVAA